MTRSCGNGCSQGRSARSVPHWLGRSTRSRSARSKARVGSGRCAGVRNSTDALARVTLDRRTGAGFGRLVWLAQFHGLLAGLGDGPWSITLGDV
jgi:hypothetical protein